MIDNWNNITLPNIPILECKLGENAIKYLWNCISYATKYPNGELGRFLYLKDDNDYFFKNHLQEQCQKYITDYQDAISFRNTFTHHGTSKLVLRDFWVNFSRKNKITPYHDHTGVLSFAIWMHIPGTSDFVMTYTDILGKIRTMNWKTNSDINGTMIVFPATLGHQVYPFNDSDQERISISGNLYLDTSDIITS